MAVLLVENGARKGSCFPVSSTATIAIGREKTTEIFLPDPMVSRRHCTIEVKAGAFRVKDLGSANGTIVNGERISDRELKVGDRILVGDTLLTLLGDDSVDPLVGKRLKGYEILERIGRGGMGTVYKARQVSLDRLVALKVLAPEMVEDPSFVARFLDEARAAARLSHPNIVMVYDIDDDVLDGQRIVYYSMEFMAGGSVEDLLNREGPLPAERALGIALETARGLQYAEQVGIVHRDIKPGNLMIHETGMVKIGDLGIAARSSKSGGMAVQKGVSGSPHYISPEQARGQDLDSRADIYSLGASLFQMLTGRPPFNATELRELLLKHLRERPADLATVVPDIHPAVPPLVAKMLEKNRDLRPANARQLIAGLEEALDRIHAPPPSRLRFLKTMVLAATATVLVVGIALGTGLLAIQYRHRLNERQGVQDRLRSGLEEARAAIAAGRIEDAEGKIKTVEDEPGLDREFPRIAEEVEAVREAVAAARAKRKAERKEAEAAEELAAVRSKLADPAKAGSAKEIEEMAAAVEEFARGHPGTAAAGEARKEVDRLRAAARALEERFERGRDAFRSLSITAGTLLEADPPRFREALEKLRDPPAEVRGTPSEKDVEEKVREMTARMIREAEAWARAAERDAGEGRAAAALERLQRLRDRVEGKAREAIDAAAARIRSATEEK